LERAFLEGVVAAGGYSKQKWKQQLCTIFTSPRGRQWSNKTAKQLQQELWSEDATRDTVFLCGRYEGVDERFLEQYIEREFSLGNFVLSGGEIAVMAIIDSALRFASETLGNHHSAQEDSFEEGLLDYPQYTKPAVFNSSQIPEVLLSGHHKNIDQWRKEQRIEQTKRFHPELLKGKFK
jgi:tRNA (guanine37-N1)-methyltransferase